CAYYNGSGYWFFDVW
nr:immunoglobulin heavy chain junction region [Mus musculus]